MANGRMSLDPRWTGHHQRVVRGFMTAQVKVIRRVDPSSLEYDRNTKSFGADMFTTVYEGPARIQPYGINFDLEIALDPTARRLVNIQIDGKSLDIRNDDDLTVTACEDAPVLMSYHFDVRGSIPSSLSWGTSVVAEANLKNG